MFEEKQRLVKRTQNAAAYERLREAMIAARVRADMTQAALAKRLGRPQSFVSKYENGLRRLDVVEVIEIATVLRDDWAEIIRAAARKEP